MKKKFIVLISIIAISLIVSVSALLITKSANNSPVSSDVACNTIKENPGGINLVFFAAEKQAKQYSDYLLTIEPFINHKDKFSIHYITPEQYQPKCDIYQGIAILCQSSALTKAASACPNDYIVVLDEKQPASIRSSAFKGVMSLNTNHPLTVFAHEFGHVFANLAEEYFAEGASIPRGSENCQKKCADFDEFPGEFGCYQECTNDNYYRECEDCVMRTLSSNEYGNYNELLIEKEINYQSRGSNTITGNAIGNTDCLSQSFYLIEIDNENIKKELVKGCPNGAKAFGDVTYQVSDESGNVVTEGSTSSNILFTTDFTDNDLITASPQEIDSLITITIPATEQEKLTVLDEQGNTLYQTSLKDVGARPCKN